jgi:hypothetical protein
MGWSELDYKEKSVIIAIVFYGLFFFLAVLLPSYFDYLFYLSIYPIYIFFIEYLFSCASQKCSLFEKILIHLVDLIWYSMIALFLGWILNRKNQELIKKWRNIQSWVKNGIKGSLSYFVLAVIITFIKGDFIPILMFPLSLLFDPIYKFLAPSGDSIMLMVMLMTMLMIIGVIVNGFLLGILFGWLINKIKLKINSNQKLSSS